MTTLKCVECDRPAQLKKKTIERAANDGYYTKKVYESVCPCGGVIKLIME